MLRFTVLGTTYSFGNQGLASTATVAYWSLGIVDNPYRLMDHLNPVVWLPAVG